MLEKRKILQVVLMQVGGADCCSHNHDTGVECSTRGQYLKCSICCLRGRLHGTFSKQELNSALLTPRMRTLALGLKMTTNKKKHGKFVNMAGEDFKKISMVVFFQFGEIITLIRAVTRSLIGAVYIHIFIFN